MNGESGYGVATGTLVSAGEKLVAIADGSAEAVGAVTGTVEGLGGVNKGFMTSSRVESLAEQWHRQVDDLAKRTSVAGDLLQQSADSYETMEQAVLETWPPLDAED